ncbi:MAG: glycosyltransferase family 39 protein [Saprospiraceae bacterium]|nr:glycosyltransferase family 39 protein [Saprospiraceae bacterium]
MKISNSKLVLIILIIGFLIRLGFVIVQYNNNVMIHYKDDALYMTIAEEVMEQGPFVNDISNIKRIDIVGYGLPWIMALFMSVFGKSWLVLFVLNSIINIISVYLIYIISKKLFGNFAGIISLIIGVFYVLFFKYLATAGKEPWIIFLVLSNFYFFMKIEEKRKSVLVFILFVVTYVYLIHVDERFIVFSVVYFFSFILIFRGGEGLKKAFVFTFFVLLLMIPWTIRNYHVNSKIFLLSKRTSVFTDKILGYETDYDITIGNMEKECYLNENQIDSVTSGLKKYFDSGRKIPKEQIDAMRQGMLPKKFSKLKSILVTTVDLWKPIDFIHNYEYTGYKFDGKWSLKHNLSVGLTYGVVLIFALFSLIFFLVKRKNSKWINLMLIFILIYTIIHSVVMGWAVPRYSLHLQGFIIIIASYSLSYFTKKIIPSKWIAKIE